MPFVAVHIARGRPLEKRRRLAIAITDAISEIFELERDQTQVLIHEHDRDNWAIGGELLSERMPAKAPDVPSVLVELGYVSNKGDLEHLVSESWRSKTVAAMGQAIDVFLAKRLATAGAARGR